MSLILFQVDQLMLFCTYFNSILISNTLLLCLIIVILCILSDLLTCSLCSLLFIPCALWIFSLGLGCFCLKIILQYFLQCELAGGKCSVLFKNNFNFFMQKVCLPGIDFHFNSSLLQHIKDIITLLLSFVVIVKSAVSLFFKYNLFFYCMFSKFFSFFIFIFYFFEVLKFQA